MKLDVAWSDGAPAPGANVQRSMEAEPLVTQTIGVNASPHDFRHDKASVMLNQGAKLSEVQDILGHASPETTKKIYAHYETAHLREAFDRYLHAGGPASVPRRRLAPPDAVRLIRRAGGVPVLAHPGLADRDDLIPDLVAAGLLGIECWYAEHSAQQTAHYLDLCRRWDLVSTGGSDFHGVHTGRAVMLGSPPLGMEVWERLRDRIERARAAADPEARSRA